MQGLMEGIASQLEELAAKEEFRKEIGETKESSLIGDGGGTW